MGRFFVGILNQITRYYAVVIGSAYLALVVFGIFTYDRVVAGGPQPGPIALLGILMFLLTWRIAVLALTAPDADTHANKIELGYLLMVIAVIALQVSGGAQSVLFPAFFLFTALAAYFLGILPTLVLTIIALATLTMRAWIAETLVDQWSDFTAAYVYALLFALIVGVLVRIAHERARRAQETLSRLTEEANHLTTERHSGLRALSRNQVARADLSALLQLDAVLTELADITKRALSGHTCVIVLIGNKPDSAYARAVSSNEHYPEEYFSENLNDTVLQEGLSGGRLRFEHLRELPRQTARHRNWGIKPLSLLMAPLVENGHVAGVIAIDSQYEAHFDREDERFLDVMARQVMAAIGRERLYRDVTAERTEFAAFYGLIKKLGSSIDLDTVSRVILESVQDILTFDFALLVMVDHEKQSGLIEAVAGLPADKWLDTRFPLHDSLVGWVIGSKTYLHYPNLRDRGRGTERRRPVFSKDLPLKDVGSLLCVPLVQQNFVTGLLAFGTKKPNAYSPYEIKILEVLAVQAAVSLENARVHAEMEQMATRDGLTGCFNHRYFQEWLDHELHRATRMPIPISLIICDIDHFKKFNDTYGHPIGDQVLRAVASVLRTSVRKNDLAARYGGEEFALVLLNSKAADAVKLAERIRKAVAATEVRFAGERLRVTISMGVATYPDQSTEKSTLIDLADKALYAAKQGGRDRVMHAADLKFAAETQ
ncbi:MAG: diguanylate cyclase [Candidatus Lernaella stagnicola]|nr:diguanylate cyclase [Candidatus Lernaella stagnicola]